jgi:hypothetical protein
MKIFFLVSFIALDFYRQIMFSYYFFFYIFVLLVWKFKKVIHDTEISKNDIQNHSVFDIFILL